MKYSAILEKVKLRGDRQRMTLEELVLQYQAGDIAVFDTIYQMTESERESTVRWLRTATPSTLSFPELYAMYDDALFTATETYAEGHNCKFITHLKNVLENLRLKEIERVGAAKRGANVDSISFQQEPEDSMSLADVIEDRSATADIGSVEGSDILNWMNEYSTLSDKKRENALLILQDTMHFETAKEKYDRMRKVMNCDMTDAALRKKCQRAKADFRLFVEENKK